MMEKELEMLAKHHGAWEVVDCKPWMNVLPSTWAFKCKWFLSGLICKLKARFCAHSDWQIEGIDYFDTFSLVVNWTTVHLLLIMSIILGLSTKQADCTAAFLHAPIDHDPNWENMMEEECAHSGIYVSMPCGFTQPGKVLKLKRSLYGLKQSPKNFFSLLKNKLESCGFSAIEDIDPCLFISDKVICLTYVDDLLFFSLQAQYIDEAIAQLSSEDLTLEVEDSVAGFLGVHIECNKMDGSIKLTQLGLAQCIVEALDVSQLPRKDTPASTTPLVQDKDRDPLNGVYNYASVIGMLQYLQNQTQPDITYAISQCAHFVHSPKQSHKIALEWIGQYLKGMLQEGLILKSTFFEIAGCYRCYNCPQSRTLFLGKVPQNNS